MNILYEVKKTKLQTIRITNLLRFHKFQSVIYVTNIPKIKPILLYRNRSKLYRNFCIIEYLLEKFTNNLIKRPFSQGITDKLKIL